MADIRKADVVVVGAGPAGSTAAFFLAQAGVKVVVVEQATFPRDKICGDGVFPRAVGTMAKMGLLRWVKSQGYSRHAGFRFGAPDGTTARAPAVQGSAPYNFSPYLIPRMELDLALIRRAVDAGAQLVEGVRAVWLERLEPGQVHVVGEEGGAERLFAAPLVIAADGGVSSFTRKLGLMPGPADIVAARQYFEGAATEPGLTEIHWDPSVLPGYGWIFHEVGGRVNVGIGMYAHEAKARRANLHALLETFRERNSHAREALENARPLAPSRGFPLRTDAHRVTPAANNVMLAGESAGLVHPMTGEGIGPSMICGELAAAHARRALAAGDFSMAVLEAYVREFHKTFDPIHRAARVTRKFLAYPWFVNRVMRRAARDPGLAAALSQAVGGVASPLSLLTPSVALRVLAG